MPEGVGGEDIVARAGVGGCAHGHVNRVERVGPDRVDAVLQEIGKTIVRVVRCVDDAIGVGPRVDEVLSVRVRTDLLVQRVATAGERKMRG